MGPPKKKPPREGVDMRVQHENHFEYRWDTSQGNYYLFNPYTGETVLGEDYNCIDRYASMWHPPDKFVSKEAYSIQLWPQGYASRKWGIRDFDFPKDEHGETTFESYKKAATLIKAAYRGHLARQALRQYYRDRYFKETCKFSHYDYFVDRWTMEDHGYDTVWTKPMLARPGDIIANITVDPDDHMADGDKYTYRGFIKGPYLKQESLGKGNCTRAVQTAFTIENEFRPQAVSKYEDIDLDKSRLGDVIAWFDGLKVVPLPISNYVQVRAAICGNNWDKVLEVLDRYPDQVLTRMYCYHSFSKTQVPMEGSKLSFASAEVLKRLIATFSNKHNKTNPLEKTFMLNALHNLLVLRAGRAEFLSTSHINSGNSDERQREIERFFKSRVTMLNKYLAIIEMDTQTFKEQGATTLRKERTPSPRGCALVSASLQVLNDLSWEIELKEVMSEQCTEYIYYALKRCKLDGAVQMFGMKVLYSLVYRNEGGQEHVLANDSTGLLAMVRENHGGDPDVEFETRRLELALKKDGWRGNVERCMSLEIRGKKLPEKYLRVSPYERRFPPGYMFPLEDQEEERNAEIDNEENRLLEIEVHKKEEAAYRKEKAAQAKAEAARIKAEKKAKGVESKLLQATDAEGNPVVPAGASIASADAKNSLERIESKDEHDDEDDNILGRIADLESKLEDYRTDGDGDGTGADGGGADAKEATDEVKDGSKGGDDDDVSVMSGLTLPDNLGSEMPTALPSPEATPIQTPLFKSRKTMGGDAKEAKDGGDDAKAEAK